MMTKFLCMMVAVMAIASPAYAGSPYLGVTLGAMNADDVRGVSFDGATAMGILGGYDFGGAGVRPGIEVEFTTTVSDGDFEYAGQRGKWDIDTASLFGTLRFGDTYYVKVRAGMVHEEVSAEVMGIELDGDDTGFGGGIGVGLELTDTVNIEGNWTYVEEDLDAWSLGVIANF